MADTEVYKSHWANEEFTDTFIAFKDFTLDAERYFADQSARIILDAVPERKPEVLEIGIGNGIVTKFFIEALQRECVIKHYCGIDVSAPLIAKAKSELKIFQDKVPLELVEADAITFKPDFVPNIVVALNAWYGIPFEAIKHYRDFLNEGGVLAILLNSSTNLTIDVAEQFKKEESVTSSERIIGWLESEGISHKAHYLTFPAYSRNNFLDKNGVKPEAMQFFRYILRGDRSRISEIVEYVRTKPESYFQLPQHLIVVQH